MRKISCFCCLLFLTVSFAVCAETQPDRFPDEDFIPFYVELTQDYQAEQANLKKGTRAVVLRPVGSTRLRVSISRSGTFTIPASASNVHEEIERMQGSDDPNLRIVPRMSFFLGNRIMTGESGWQNPLRNDVINAASRWFLLYGNAKDAETSEAVSTASKFYNALTAAERARTVFVYMDLPGNKEAIAKLADAMEPSIQCMPGYLSKGYSKSLDHIELNQEMPQLVEVASSGRVLRHVKGLDAVRTELAAEEE